MFGKKKEFKKWEEMRVEQKIDALRARQEKPSLGSAFVVWMSFFVLAILTWIVAAISTAFVSIGDLWEHLNYYPETEIFNPSNSLFNLSVTFSQAGMIATVLTVGIIIYYNIKWKRQWKTLFDSLEKRS